ncbi:MAG: hypothetical protein JWM34_3519 [Ilumatobacteraceae bacterium]|nr:hypothetical protein [Ilumatobacteraceae bacterium]
MTTSELETLRLENAELLQRVTAAEAAIAELRSEALERRQQVRSLVADLPVAMSRKTLLKQVASDAVHHPDKRGVVVRAVNKVRRKLRGRP